MRYPCPRLALVLGACIALTACGGPGLDFIPPPENKLTCPVVPGRPAGTGEPYVGADGVTRNAITDEDNGEHLRDLRGVATGCRSNLLWVADYIHEWTEKRKAK